MKLQFLGATGSVTGSRTLVRHAGFQLLVDCGLFQGYKELRLRNWEDFPVEPSSIDAVALTHAHLDHSGYLPLLVKKGFRGPIYATPATIALCRILLPDCGYLQEEEARLANQEGYSRHKPAQPLYTAADAERCLSSLVPVLWNQPLPLQPDSQNRFEIEFYPAGHLLGAASVCVRTDTRSVGFSGDVGRATDPMIRAPNPAFAPDSIVLESTYGDRAHPEFHPEQELRDVVRRTAGRGGILLIPSFAVGRAQLLLHYLHGLRESGAIPDLPVYLNSPMAAQANRAFAAHSDELRISKDQLDSIWKSVRIVRSTEESIALCRRGGPSIIIASSGMATGGRVLHHLKQLLPDERNTVLFAGYQAGGTRGDRLVRGEDRIKIHGALWPVRAEILHLESLSGHADASELIQWVKSLQKTPARIFLNHGEPAAADALRYRIEAELGIEALVPHIGQEVSG